MQELEQCNDPLAVLASWRVEGTRGASISPVVSPRYAQVGRSGGTWETWGTRLVGGTANASLVPKESQASRGRGGLGCSQCFVPDLSAMCPRASVSCCRAPLDAPRAHDLGTVCPVYASPCETTWSSSVCPSSAPAPCRRGVPRRCCLPVNFVGTVVTALVTLLGVALGGVLSVRNADRSWRRNHTQQWRDIRLTAYGDFVSAIRQYFVFAVDPDTRVLSMTRGNLPSDPIPIFGEAGRLYNEKLDATMLSVRLVSEHLKTVTAANELVRRARLLAAARATYSIDELPGELFDCMLRAQYEFVQVARLELGLSEVPWMGDHLS